MHVQLLYPLKDQQRNWIGKSTGINITYEVEAIDDPITVFTTRPDTNFGATFIVLAPEHAYITKHLSEFPNKEKVKEYIEATTRKTERERISEGKKKTGIFTGVYALNNLNGKKLPLYIGDFVLATVGTGAVVGVPGHDIRDFEFAKAMGIDVVRVVVGPDGDTSEIKDGPQVQEEQGTMINSGFLDGMEIHEAKTKIMDYLEEKGWGKRVVNYRIRDWLVSRQRYWGAPIPVVYDPQGNPHPVDESDLPVLLPYNVNFKPTGESPLKYSEEFHKSAEEKYGKGWRREVDTMDTFVDSSWYFFRHLSAEDDKRAFDPEKADAWLPTDLYMIGPEHIVLHLLYSRFFTKFFFDQKIIHFDEPFYTMRHMGTILGTDGRKMSKRWGNVINPTDVGNEYGADTLRVYEMFMGPLAESKPWDDRNVQGAYRFLNRIWKFFNSESLSETEEDREVVQKLHKTIKKVTEDIPQLKFNTAIASMMEFLNVWENKKLSKNEAKKFLQILAPFAPFISEELWHTVLGEKESVHRSTWPKSDDSLLVDEEIIIPVQVNGKVRGTIEVSSNETNKDVIVNIAVQDEKVKKFIEGKEYKVIYVPGRILNLIVKA
jgi:leucyl-tRNA synthetase